MKKSTRVYYVIRRDVLERTPVEGVLDMLRYDGATVENNAPAGYYLLSSDQPGPHEDRWQSFGVVVAYAHTDRYRVEEWARAEGREP